MQLLKRSVLALVLMVGLTLQSCVNVGAAGLNSYINDTDGFRFLYPIGWEAVQLTNGPTVVFHDIIEETENISVLINPVPGRRSLQEIGTPSEVGAQLSKSAIAPEDSGRTAELLSAQAGEIADKVYYLLEYAIKMPDGKARHSLVSAVVSRGRLLTFNASTPEIRWGKMKELLDQSAKSFTVN